MSPKGEAREARPEGPSTGSAVLLWTIKVVSVIIVAKLLRRVGGELLDKPPLM